MSRRDITTKKLYRLRKQLVRQSLPAYINLIEWLKDRRYAQTSGAAKKMLLEGKVRVDSHPVGRRPLPGGTSDDYILDPYTSAENRSRIMVARGSS